MDTSWLFIVFLFGTIIGSFLNVVIYRFHTGRSMNGRSHCMSCGEMLRWYELLPVVSYFTLGGKCKSCDAYVPFRYVLVELATGLVFFFLFLHFSTDYLQFALHAFLASLLIVIVTYDLRHTIIPDELTVGVGTVAFMHLVLVFLGEGSVVRVLYDILAGMGAGLFFYLLWYYSKGRWIGLGDAKLATPLGVIAGTGGALSMVVLSFWIGALVSVILLLLIYVLEKGKTVLPFLPKRLTMKSEVPFAPFLVLGFLCALYLHANIFEITAALFPFFL